MPGQPGQERIGKGVNPLAPQGSLRGKIPLCRNGGTMNKQELIERMAGKTGLTKKDCGTALDGFLSAVTEALQAGEAVKLT